MPTAHAWINKIGLSVQQNIVQPEKELINATLINLENIMLRSQTQKVIYCMVLFISNIQNR